MLLTWVHNSIYFLIISKLIFVYINLKTKKTSVIKLRFLLLVNEFFYSSFSLFSVDSFT